MDFLFERLTWIAEQTTDSTPWRATVLNLCRHVETQHQSMQAQGERLIEAARLLRASHKISREAYFYVVSWVVENLAEAEIDEIFARDFAARFREIERSHGMRSYWEFREGTEPPEYVALCEEFDQRMIGTTAEGLRKHNEPVLAELYERDREEYLRLKKHGRFSLLGTGLLEDSHPS
jgi:hypothetical protein